MGKITKEEEKLFAEMKQLKKQIVPDAHLIEQTKKRVFDEDKLYHHTFLMIAIPTTLILFLAGLYYFAYARPTASLLYEQTIQQEKKQKKNMQTETMTATEEKELYENAGQEQGLTKKQIDQLHQKGKKSTSSSLCKSVIGIRKAKITIETVTICKYGSVSIRLYEDQTSYQYERGSGGWHLTQQTIEQL